MAQQNLFPFEKPYIIPGREHLPVMDEAPRTEVVAPGVEQIPFEFLARLGAIFSEGQVKYGLDNWKKCPEDADFNRQRMCHAIRHLMLYANGDRGEDHLAKVGWFVATTIYRECQVSKEVKNG